MEKEKNVSYDVATDPNAAKAYIANLMLELNELREKSNLFHDLLHLEQALDKKEKEVTQKLAEANQKLEARQQQLNEIAIQKFQIENLVELLKKKNKEKIKALKKKVSSGKMTEYNLEWQAKKLDREILATLKKRPSSSQKSKPFFTYS